MDEHEIQVDIDERCQCPTYTGSERRPDDTKVCERCGKKID